MITVKVTYGVKKEFLSENKENIALFMADFKALNNDGFQYDVYMLEDGETFVHISSYGDAEIQQMILNVPSFKQFQKQRDESGLTKPHTLEVLNLIASSHKE